MPKKCPECKGKVKLCHINPETNDGVIMCPGMTCGWPFNSDENYKEFSGFSDAKLYQKWQEELKKKKKKNKGALSTRRASSVSSGTDDVDSHSKNDDPVSRAGSIVEKSHISSIFDVQVEADTGPSRKESKKHTDANVTPPHERVAVPDISSKAKANTPPIVEDDSDTFLLPEKPVSGMTPRRRDVTASDSEDFGDISDAEPDFNVFRHE